VPLTREEEGAGIAAGAALAGERPAIFVQSSGVGNMLNALLSLTQFYGLPLALFVSRRGMYQEKIAAQLPMGKRLASILRGAGISVTIVNTAKDLALVRRKLPEVYRKGLVHAFLLSPRVWERSECGVRNAERGMKDAVCGTMAAAGFSPRDVARPSLTRFEIIKLLAPQLAGKIVVSNLGWPSKELYHLGHQPSNFYMLGSMGMASPVGLGLALATDKEVVVIDGDGSLLMNPGTLATAAAMAPVNLTIIAIDNGAYGSTGNQPTLAASCVDLETVTRGFGFTNTSKASTGDEMLAAWDRRGRGPAFLHFLAKPGNAEVPNIPLSAAEIRDQVRKFLKG
jgi:sulfopyruvate decarboxylase subunit beta